MILEEQKHLKAEAKLKSKNLIKYFSSLLRIYCDKIDQYSIKFLFVYLKKLKFHNFQILLNNIKK